MKRVKSTLTKFASAGMLNALVAIVAVQSVGKACLWFFHQPTTPKMLDEYRIK